MVMSLERRGILAPLPSKQIIIVPSIQRSQTHDVAYEYMILTLDCRLRKMMIVPSNVLGYFLQVAFYDHTMSLRYKDHKTHDVAYEYMILTLDCRLRKMMIVHSDVLGYFLQVAFYDHPMSLRMSRVHPTNRVTYQLMVWIALF